MPFLLVAALFLPQDNAGTIELKSLSRESYGAAELIVEADGTVSKCNAAPRPYDNVLPPPSICAAYPIGTRYSAPATYKGKPQRRRVTIKISTYETSIK